ncbi:unnamed protein product [Rotaria sp. Silwood2]|nr:unnamed protein product [Rotaria sp. Silwood2]
MLLLNRLLYFILLVPSLVNSSQINLYLTDWAIDNVNGVTLQHNCLYVATSINDEKNAPQILSYCMGEWPSRWSIHKSNFDRIFTFAELNRLQITSRQLYTWSAPIDLVERYQSYLNQLQVSNETSMGTQFFYNCTLLQFGPICQYSIDDYDPHQSSLNEIIAQFYSHGYKPTTFTCYVHLQCNRGPALSCLDWSEICDGKIDCVDGGHDEENCWQLEINDCGNDEYRCSNGQCIPYTFFRDDSLVPDCLDGSDEVSKFQDKRDNCDKSEPTFACEDVVCMINSQYFYSPFTSSCVKQRSELLLKAMFLHKPNSMSHLCWLAFMCVLHMQDNWIADECFPLCKNRACSGIIESTCPDMFYLPPIPILFNQVYFAYTNKNVEFSIFSSAIPHYICFNGQLCSQYFVKYESIMFNNTICYRPKDLGLYFRQERATWVHLYVTPLFKLLHTCYEMVDNSSALCNRSTMYQCINSSKCISRNRLNDGIIDCFYHDDEQLNMVNNTCLLERFIKHFKCIKTNQCISYRLVNDGTCHCREYWNGLCDDEFTDVHYARNHILFQIICDGFNELIPVIIDGRNETDETECEQWQCNNTYTRCDGFWNCLNGADEINCDSLGLLDCPLHHHICVSTETKRLTCLPIEKADDGQIDCLGGTDEPGLCRENHYLAADNNFYCKNDTRRTCLNYGHLCNRYDECEYGDDEQVCDTNRNFTIHGSVCFDNNAEMRSDVEKFFCERFIDTKKQRIVHFSLGIDRNSSINATKSNRKRILPHSFSRQTNKRCHRGFDLRVWLDKDQNLTTTTCLCPPSFYGDMCQYQNQRVSLTMQYRAFSDAWRTPFVLVVMVIDDSDERTIHSHEQFTYLPMRDCQIKFHSYLFYSTRPKNNSINYSVHIDIYEKLSLAYRGSWFLPLKFPFLSVHRLAVQLDIPHSVDSIKSCSDLQCVHGHCARYSNNQDGSSFCQCNQGWSGQYCTIPHTCTCSSDSLCVGISANNRSLCVCSINRFGPRCLLDNTLCELDQNTKCLHGGQCIPVDEHILSERKFTCICSKGFSGDRCEIPDSKIIVSFHKDILLSQAMLVHFIRVIDNALPERATTFKTIPVHQNSIIIYWSRPFHLVFIELFNKSYYLAVIQRAFSPSTTIIRKIKSSNRCEHITELFNKTIIKLHFLRRIKYYHVPCQRHSPKLSYFYDDIHLCLCNDHGLHRVANCFEFNHHLKSDCLGRSGCENEAQCFQDSLTCAQTSICICPTCFYGVRCQFSTSGFGLSLDSILGYHILPHHSILHQPYAVQISAVLTVIMVIAGLINGVLTLITFRSKKLREAGCGLYLIGSSITTILTMTLFGIKFWTLVSSQMSLTINRSFVYVQCLLIDFLLRICLSMDQWLNSCVAAERAITALKKVKFDKKQSKNVAKYVIVALLVLTISTAIHDPVHRRLFNDEDNDEKRIWCIVSYPFSFQLFNSVTYLFHFFIPFFINLISALIILKANARQRAIVRPHYTYQQLLREQFQQHNRLIIAPFILIILAFPRVILSLVSGCMKSAQDSWLFLIGYFISFIPPTFIFLVFILPSKLYKEEFRKAVKHYWKMI